MVTFEKIFIQRTPQHTFSLLNSKRRRSTHQSPHLHPHPPTLLLLPMRPSTRPTNPSPNNTRQRLLPTTHQTPHSKTYQPNHKHRHPSNQPKTLTNIPLLTRRSAPDNGLPAPRTSSIIARDALASVAGLRLVFLRVICVG